ncbi:hypothetical protein Tco_0810468 [Tanacetum coccineum]
MDSGKKNEVKAFTFHRMETEEVCEHYITPCFVEGLDAYDGVTDLEITKAIVDFGSGILTIYPDLIIFNDDSDDELDAL